MAIKDTILNNVLHDLTVCQHLATKIDKKNANWRPADNMRTTEELMQYISFIGGATIMHFLNPPSDRSQAMNGFSQASQWASANTNIENFSKVVEQAKGYIQSLMENVTDDQLMTKMTYAPWNPKADMTLEQAFIGSTIKFLAAYRHQLFLYAKMQGANINTMNNWAGMDAPMPVREQLQEEAV